MTTHRLRQHVHPAMRTIYRQIRILNYRLVFFATETLAKAGFGIEFPSCHNHTQGNRRQIVGLQRDFNQNSKHITSTIDNCETGCGLSNKRNKFMRWGIKHPTFFYSR